MMKLACIAALVGFALVNLSQADTGDDIRLPWVMASGNGRFLFKMVALKVGVKTRKVIEDAKPYGVAYEINTEGEFDEIWRVEGWHASEGYLADDGQHFVRIGTWPKDQEGHTDLLIAFYDRGKLLKEYRVKDLIRKPEVLENSVSHYQWRPEIQTKSNGLMDDKAFHLVLIDKTTYRFDITTGNILETGVDAGARSRMEIGAQEEAEDEKKGQAMYDGSDFRKAYDEHFVLVRPEAVRGWMSGTHIDGAQWRAHFLTRKKYAVPCEVETVFPVAADGKVKTSITPQEIGLALDKAFAHPFIQKKLASGTVQGMRLLITDDRLHWHTQYLREDLKTLTGTEPKENDTLRSWADVVIQEKDIHLSNLFYLNIETGDVIYEKESALPNSPLDLPGLEPRELVFLDAAGRPKQKSR
jgi:hypothetical protein